MSEHFSGTKPVDDHHRIDADNLHRYLKAQMGEGIGPPVIEQFKGGQSNPTYRITAGGQRYVLRKKPPGNLLPSAHAVEREFRVIRALHGAGFPVARAYFLCEDPAVIGTPFYVMECVEGRVFWDGSLPGMQRDERAAIYDELNHVIARLHGIDYRGIGLETYGKAGSYLERQVTRWSRQYKASETATIEAMDNLMAWLPANIPAASGSSIVHGDYRLDNIIFHPTESRVLAVIDWELSTIGDPLADFSYHCMTWYRPPEKFRGIAGLPLEELGIPGVGQYQARYCERTGRTPVDATMWTYYSAFNLFRMAAIAQGIVKRLNDGNASGAGAYAAEVGARAPMLAALGWEQVEKKLKRAG